MATLGPYLVSVGMIVVKEDRVLFVSKAVGKWAGEWGFPSGFVEAGETLEEAAKRELLEETGVEAELEGLLGVTNLIYRRHGVLCSEVHPLFLMSWKGGEPKANGIEVKDTSFLALEEIRGLGPRESTIRILEKALKGECLKPIRLMNLPEEFQVLTVFA